MQRRKVLGSIGLSALAVTIGAPARADAAETAAAARSAATDDWPKKPLRVILPYPPGGNTDVIARSIGKVLSTELHQPVVVENRPGANGIIALNSVATAHPDGYTLLVTAVAQLAIVPAMYDAPYDPLKDFEAVSIVATNPLVLVVGSAVPAQTLEQFVAYAKSRPDGMTYASSGNGGIPHLTAVQFFDRAGVKTVHVPYKGNAQIMGDVLGGHVPAYFANLSEVLPQMHNKGLRLLAQTGLTRAKQLPDVPTVAEQGYKGFESVTWNGVFAPSGTPASIVERLSKIIQGAVRDPAFSDRMETMGLVPLGTGPEETRARLKSDIAFWKSALDSAGIKKQK